MTKRIFSLATCLGLALASSAAIADGDAGKGKKVFNRCKTCHVIDAETNRVGPHLVGIIGRAAGAVDGFGYSEAMLNSGITWDETTIAAYLADPAGYLEGNAMKFVGLKKQDQIADVIAYLKVAAGGS